MKVREFVSELRLQIPPSQVFSFFGDAANLNRITPPWLHFRIVTPQPIVLGEGALIDYQLRVHGLPMSWRTRINVWEPPHRFVDEQIRGPYRQWIHEHTFEPCDGGTMVRDRVSYAVPFDFLLHRYFVRRDIEQIFEYRRAEMRELFPAPLQTHL